MMIVRKFDQLKQIHWNNMVLFGGIMGIMYLIALLFLLVFDVLREGVLRILPMFLENHYNTLNIYHSVKSKRSENRNVVKIHRTPKPI
ncbi:hypothetical protein QNH98_16445 [Myroides sp. mNGS23_01]|nr:hypothetical protein [Myroides sp. mNGS23_01]WHT38572.1 hypothetical protein QNH98_16445 [Myroides sp. mNGS23_01]